jgi:threonine/homoserine/homoserine lactone efflux protein
MPLETWLAYTLVTTTFLLIPGPTIILVISYSLLRGKQAVIALVLGVGLGDLTAMSLSFLGVGVLLQTVATAFYLIKWLGAAYLIWLGIKMWCSVSELTDLDKKNRSHSWWEIFSSAFITTALNPKSIVFFLAFIPQFIEPELPFTTQVVILGATFFVLAIISVLGYAALAIYAGQQLHLPLIQRWTHRIGGGLLIGAGGMTAVTS